MKLATTDIFCRHCFQKINFSFGDTFNMKMLALDLCFGCLHWHEWEVLKNDPNVARIEGKHYFIGPEDSTEPRGMSGAKAIIKFDDGREVTTTNLWYQGLIPGIWRARLRDNAKFIKQTEEKHG